MLPLEQALFFLGVFAFPLAAGLLSGVSHCAAMCGPIHLFLARQGGRGLWLYHAGRVMTYAALGALAALFARSIPLQHIAWVWVALYVALGLRLLGVPLWPSAWGIRYGGWMAARMRPLTARAADRPVWLVPLGLAAGFLPCATTQAGLVWAVGTGAPATGAAGMLLLGAGTLPLFLAWPRKWFPRKGGRFHTVLGVLLLVMAAVKIHALVTATAGAAPACH